MQQIGADEVEEILQGDENTPVINVLTKADFDREHVPGSISIPFEETSEFLQKVEKAAGGKGGKVVLYCCSIACDQSEKAANFLEEAGFTYVIHFAGGAKEWKDAGKEVAS